MEGYERKHTRNLARYAKQIEDIFAEAAAEAARIGHSVSGLSDKPFFFDDYPMAKARMEALVESMHDDLLAGIVNGIDAEWALANGQADELVAGMLAAAKLGKAVTPDRWLNNHTEALEAFKRRKIAGLGLSDRVWNYTGQFREEIEMALDLGIRSGKSAAEMSRDVRQYLRYPDKLFRRVRDEHGNLRLSKAAKAFHPGQGVYRSSYKNALRLTATETNIAYRTADFLRVQDLDFVVGIEVRLSNNHTLNGRPFFDICDELAGKYPKDFKFTGWHPFCRCHSIKILKTEEEFFADEQRLLAGEELGGESLNRVGDVPPQFKEWVRDNRERITKARAKGTEAYFLRDNKLYVDGILDMKPNALQISRKRHAARTPEQVAAIRKAWEENRAMKDRVIRALVDNKVDYIEVKPLSKNLSIDEIVKKVGGGDLTEGSCSSLAFAYAGNRLGFDVLDFRDGMSRQIFARTGNINAIAEKSGGIVSIHGNDFVNARNLLKNCQKNKEYYFTCGKHAVIVRRSDSGFEYLELQSPIENGFKPLTNNVLKDRFKAQKSHTIYGVKMERKNCLIDIELLGKNPLFRRLLGYINTELSKQVKGIAGKLK